jgi:2-polyprenyl-3-methyl-5-hydroxy-6-metoxy-1,4-benzoquinol methylase
MRVSRIRYPAVLISEVLEHLKDDLEIIESVKGALEAANGLFLLTVPNRNRFTNKTCRFLGRKSKFMSPGHLREYDRQELYDLLVSRGFSIRETKQAYFRFPKEDAVRRLVSVDSRWRELLLIINPSWADYIITASSLS